MVSIATMGMFRDCCGGGPGTGGGAPPVHQYEARAEDPAINVTVKRVTAKKSKKMPTITIDVGSVRSERKI
jgi:hypothetical protein